MMTFLSDSVRFSVALTIIWSASVPSFRPALPTKEPESEPEAEPEAKHESAAAQDQPSKSVAAPADGEEVVDPEIAAALEAWRSVVHPETGRTYYHNLVTKESTWDPPSELVKAYRKVVARRNKTALVRVNTLMAGCIPGKMDPMIRPKLQGLANATRTFLGRGGGSMRFMVAVYTILWLSASSVSAFGPALPIIHSIPNPAIGSGGAGGSPTSLLYASSASDVTPETRQFTRELKSILTSNRRQGGNSSKSKNGRGKQPKRGNQTSQTHVAEEAEQYLLANLDQADVVSVTKVVGAWSRCPPNDRTTDAPRRAEELVTKMAQLANDSADPRPALRPNTYTYNNLINCFARRGMVQKAEEYLDMMKTHNLPGMEDVRTVQVDVWTYNSVLNAHATCRKNKREGAQRALEILDEMKAASGKDGNVRPDSVTYGSVVKCLTNAGGKVNAERAEQLLNELESLYEESGDSNLQPTTILYNSVLDAYANLRGGEGIENAEALLDRMEELRSKGKDGSADGVSPDAFTFASLIKGWTSASSSSGKGKDNDSDNNGSDLLGRSAAERAQQLLDRMEELHRGGDDAMRPTTVLYNTVLAAWAKSGEKGAAERAEELLGRMQRAAAAKDAGGDVPRADTVSFNSAIDAWARAEEYGSAEKAENLLNSMEKQYIAGNSSVKPDVRTYNSCINAWSRTGGPGAGLRAEQLLDRLEALYDETGDEDVRPNQVTYASVINAHAKSFKKGCGEFAEAILDHMEELYEDDGVAEARPNPIAFSAVLQAWKNSEAGLTPPRAEGLLLRMLEFVDRQNGREVRYANRTFDLAVKILEATYDQDAIVRIESLRNQLELE